MWDLGRWELRTMIEVIVDLDVNGQCDFILDVGWMFGIDVRSSGE
jgi:hypothetical protein